MKYCLFLLIPLVFLVVPCISADSISSEDLIRKERDRTLKNIYTSEDQETKRNYSEDFMILSLKLQYITESSTERNVGSHIIKKFVQKKNIPTTIKNICIKIQKAHHSDAYSYPAAQFSLNNLKISFPKNKKLIETYELKLKDDAIIKLVHKVESLKNQNKKLKEKNQEISKRLLLIEKIVLKGQGGKNQANSDKK